MVRGYVMVRANTGEADRLRDDIEALEGVDHAYIVAGDVDIIVRADLETPADVKHLVADRIQSISGVADTSTYIAMS